MTPPGPPLLVLLVAASILAMTGCKAQPAANRAEAGRAQAQADRAQMLTPAIFHVDPATAGTITGKVHYNGPKPKPSLIDMSSDPACVASHRGKASNESIITAAGGLGNAFVYISKGLEGKTFATPGTPVTIDQAGCTFRPHVLGLQTGQTLDVVNSDPVTHNIHPMAHINSEWNHSQGPGDPPMHRRFLRPEVMIPVKCNIHGWMHAYVGVVDHPYFTVTHDDGAFTLPNLPPGTYTVTAWHQTLGTQTATVTVAAGSDTQANLNFQAK